MNQKGTELYPVKIQLTATSNRQIYFDKKSTATSWAQQMACVAQVRDLKSTYTCKQVLGKGSFGEVLLAQGKTEKNQVAIKTVLKSKFNNAEHTQHLLEMNAMLLCNHPNVVKLQDVISSAKECHMVMDYVHGKDLFDYLKSRGFRLNEGLAKRLIFKLLKGLSHVHAMGVVHRDLKLENVIMTSRNDDAEPIICDFGLSKILVPGQKTNEPYGTMGYTAPEVMLKQLYSFEADSWSMGCISYALICGTLPYSPTKDVPKMLSNLRERTLFTEKSWYKTSNGLKDMINRLLSTNVATRLTVDQAIALPYFDSIRESVL